MHRAIVASVQELAQDPQWLGSRPCPVIAYGVGEETVSADVLVPDLAAARAIEKRVEAWPIAAMTLVQVLRSTAEVAGMGLMGLGGLLAIVGGLLFVVVVVRAVGQAGVQSGRQAPA